MSAVEEWLTSIGLGEYSQRFAENAIDLSVVADLTEQDLQELGLPLGHRRKFLRAVATLRAAEVGPPQPDLITQTRETAERRQLTVMFCDLVGSTSLSAQLDPEDMRGVIAAYQECSSEVVKRYTGMIARYMGDGILAYFGYPQAQEDSAEQAVRAGLALVEAVSKLETQAQARLRVRVGIATGTVVVGDLLMSQSGAQEQVVVGDTPNLASRLQAIAEPDQVIICANTRQLAGGHFEYRDLGGVTLKGWSDPVPAWQVLRATEIHSRFEARHTNLLDPPLGREEELDILLRRWRQASEGECRVVVITGEPGIGKSHLILALRKAIEQQPHILLQYYCSAHHTNSALFPIIVGFERTAGIERTDSATQKLAKLEALLARWGTPADRAALIASLLSLPADPDLLPADWSPQRRKEATLAALSAQLDGFASRRPVLVLFEDAHWSDPTSLELVASVVERAPPLPILLVVTGRAEFKPPWPNHAHVTTVQLTRLDRRYGAALIERVAGKALPQQLVTEILQRTDGVPLFIEELTKAVLESGALQERDGEYVMSQSLLTLAIPTTLQASLMARLDRLAPARDVAQIGAAVGREFYYELISAIAGLPRQRLEESLGELVRSELVFCRGDIPQAVYSFKHALVRDAAYSGLLKSRRLQLHAAIANVLEQRFPDIVEAEPETLARHLTEAGLVEKAAGYWVRAGKNAAMRSANLEAIAHLQRGLESVAGLPEGSEKDRLELDLQLALAPCLIATQGPASSASVSTFARAHALCERLGDPPERLQVVFWLATACVIRGELPKAEEMVRTLIRLAESRNERAALLNATRGMSMILLFMGRLAEAREAVERAVASFNASDEAVQFGARAAGQDAGVANLALMSWALWLLGDVEQAIARSDEAVRRADGLGHPHSRAYALYYASVLHTLCGDIARAHHQAVTCYALSVEHGFRQWRGLSAAVRGICSTLMDPGATSLPEVKAALDEYRGAGYQLGITVLDVLLCQALMLIREPEAALEVIEQGLATAQQNQERIFEAELYRLKAHALRARGAPDGPAQMQALLELSLSTARRQGARSLELRAAADLASIRAEPTADQATRDGIARSAASASR